MFTCKHDTFVANYESAVNSNFVYYVNRIIPDVLFYVRMKSGLSQIIINVEAQKDEPAQYCIINRAVFYVSRMISSQKERDFQKNLK